MPMVVPFSKRLRLCKCLCHILSVVFLTISTLCPSVLQALPHPAGPRAQLQIPRVGSPPKFEDFLGMEPRGEIAAKMSKVEGFSQYVPKDGEPAAFPTEV